MTNKAHQNEKKAFEWLNELVVPENLTKEDFLYPGDRKMLSAFKKVPGADRLTRKFLNFMQNSALAELKKSSKQVTDKQLPELNDVVVKISDILGIAPPQTFLEDSPEINACATGPDEENACVIICRGLYEICRPRELAYVLGHEMGHIKSEHVLYHTLARYIAKGLFSFTAVHPFAKAALLAWSRRSEITADRTGLIACQDLNSAQRALALIELGEPELVDQIDIEELEQHGTKGIGQLRELFHEHPYTTKRLKAIKIFAASHLYMCKIKRNTDAYLTMDDVNYYVGKILRNK